MVEMKVKTRSEKGVKSKRGLTWRWSRSRRRESGARPKGDSCCVAVEICAVFWWPVSLNRVYCLDWETSLRGDWHACCS